MKFTNQQMPKWWWWGDSVWQLQVSLLWDLGLSGFGCLSNSDTFKENFLFVLKFCQGFLFACLSLLEGVTYFFKVLKFN